MPAVLHHSTLIRRGTFNFLVIGLPYSTVSDATQTFPYDPAVSDPHQRRPLCRRIASVLYCIPYRTFSEVMNPRFSIGFALMRTHALYASD